MTRDIKVATVDGATVTALAYPADAGDRLMSTFVLAHGAGAGQVSPFIVRFAIGLCARGLDVLTFNFLYTEQRRRIPDRADRLEACYRDVIRAAHESFPGNALFIGGKSMGGRIASQVAAGDDAGALDIRGLIFLGYPLHPPGKPDKPRTVHLPSIKAPMLFIQGTRDPFGTPNELRLVSDRLRAPVTLHAIEKGDHSLAPSRNPVSVDTAYNDIQAMLVQWVRTIIAPAAYSSPTA